MKFFFTGGTGFIGSILITQLLKDGHEITMLVVPKKKVTNTREKVTVIEGSPTEPGSWQEGVAEHDVIINLAGTSIFQRWNSKVRKNIYDSRIVTTRNIVEALKNGKKRRIHLFSASGVGYYGYHHGEILDEGSSPGDGFLARVAVDWEAEALKAQGMGIRVVLCRFGIVLGRQRGALKRTIPLFKLFLGGRWGRGEQWFSWIHERDLVGSFLFLLERREIEGPLNFTAPHPVQNREMAHLLKKVLGRKTILSTIPGVLVRGILGECSEVFLKGQRVLPRRFLENGYTFQFPKLEDCLKNLLSS